MIQNNLNEIEEEKRRSLNELEQNQQFHRKPRLIINGNKASDAFAISVFINPFKQIVLLNNKIKNITENNVEQTITNLKTFQDFINEIIKKNDQYITAKYYKEYADQIAEKELRQLLVIDQVSKLQYNIRRCSSLISLEEIQLYVLFKLVYNIYFKTSANDRLQQILGKAKEDQLKSIPLPDDVEQVQLELYFLQRINYCVKYDYPENYLFEFINHLRIIQTTQMIVIFTCETICQFACIEGLLYYLQESKQQQLLLNPQINTREVLYKQTSRFQELSQCRQFLFRFGQPNEEADINKFQNNVLNLHDLTLNIDLYIDFLRTTFRNIKAE